MGFWVLVWHKIHAASHIRGLTAVVDLTLTFLVHTPYNKLYIFVPV